MKNSIKTIGLIAGSIFLMSTASIAQNSVMVGGVEMLPNKNVVENASKSQVHTTLVRAVLAADLSPTLAGKGPYTVFAPVDDAFENLPDGMAASYLEPANKPALKKVLGYHVVPGALDFDAIAALIKKGNGSAEMTTVSGGKLTAQMNGKHNITIKDENGGVANIITYDVYQSNGVIHVIDKVALPKM